MNKVLETVKKYWVIEDTIPITLVLGALKATLSSRIWLRILGRGGGEGKSTLLESIETIPQCKAKIANYFTAASLRGGFKDGGTVSEFMGGKKLLIIPESSAFNTARSDTRAEIAGLLRSVYDGDITAIYGSDAKVVTNSFTFSLFIAGNRNSLGKDSILEAQLGQRWVDVDWHLTNRSGSMTENERTVFKAELANTIEAMLEQSTDVEDVAVDIDELCRQVAALRGYIPRDINHKVIGNPVIENTSRLTTTFTAIGKGIAGIGRRSCVGISTYNHLLPLAVGCIPENRVNLLRILLGEMHITNEALGKGLGCGREMARIYRDDINLLLQAGNITIKDLLSSGLTGALIKPVNVAWWQQSCIAHGREVPAKYQIRVPEFVFATT